MTKEDNIRAILETHFAGFREDLIESAVKMIVRLEVRHGKWKPFDLTWGRSVYTCTACGNAFEVPTECGKPMYEFCPYCGASMDEVEEPEINPCRGCEDYDGRGSCISKGGCGVKMEKGE